MTSHRSLLTLYYVSFDAILGLFFFFDAEEYDFATDRGSPHQLRPENVDRRPTHGGVFPPQKSCTE